MTIKTQEVAYLKTSGEAVMVMEYPNEAGKVTVRRPVMGQNGINHRTEIFEYFELETLAEQKKRFFAEREELLEKFGPKTSAPTDEFSLSN